MKTDTSTVQMNMYSAGANVKTRNISSFLLFSVYFLHSPECTLNNNLIDNDTQQVTT